jgi:hypothetical protein
MKDIIPNNFGVFRGVRVGPFPFPHSLFSSLACCFFVDFTTTIYIFLVESFLFNIYCSLSHKCH